MAMTRTVSSSRVPIRNIPYSIWGHPDNARRINCGSSDTILDGKGFTVAFYASVSLASRLWTHGFNFGTNKGYLMRCAGMASGSTIQVFCGSSTVSFTGAVKKLDYGAWHHYAVSFDGVSTWKLYVDFVLVDTKTGAFPRNADTGGVMAFMSEGVGTLNKSTGMTELLVIDRVMTADEITALKNANYPSDVLGFFPCDEGSGTDVHNESGSLATATLVGGANIAWRTSSPSKIRTAASNRVAITIPRTSV